MLKGNEGLKMTVEHSQVPTVEEDKKILEYNYHSIQKQDMNLKNFIHLINVGPFA